MISREEIKYASGRTVHRAKTPVNGGRVLLVEDTPALRRLLEIVLERAGYEVVSTVDGLEATQLLMSTSVDIVVTDALMPNLDGYGLCRFIRNSRQLSHIPIVLLSALDPDEPQAEHVNAFLLKPVSPEDLLGCVSALLLNSCTT